jgi:hypothetical protein
MGNGAENNDHVLTTDDILVRILFTISDGNKIKEETLAELHAINQRIDVLIDAVMMSGNIPPHIQTSIYNDLKQIHNDHIKELSRIDHCYSNEENNQR